MSKFFKIFLTIRSDPKKFALLLIIAVVLIVYFLDLKAYNSALQKPLDKANKSKIMFVIRSGETAKSVAGDLEDKELISNNRYFYKYMKSRKTDTKIIAGAFSLSPSMTIPEIGAIITDPSKNQYVLTVPEGFLARDIDARLTEMGLIKTSEFISAVKNFKDYKSYDFLDEKILKKLDIPLEGYLFPDTYFLSPDNFSSNDLIKQMLANFRVKAMPEIQKNIAHIQNSSVEAQAYNILIMASLLEKEGRTPDEFALISGILWKRLQNNWFLDVDAALLYETGKKTISSEDLKTISPYNLRRSRGFPPSPISNPGLNAINAAIYPKSSPYWFYLTTPSGQTIYSKTNDEHNLNKAKYLK